jgi:hypothetical protein
MDVPHMVTAGAAGTRRRAIATAGERILLTRQVSLLRMGALWCAPIFLGTALIGLWHYQERSATSASFFWAVAVAGWVVVSVGGMSMGAKLDERRLRMERLLADLT